MTYTKTFENRQSGETDIGERLALADLHHHVRWCAWQEETRRGKDGLDRASKVPYGRNLGDFKANDPLTWTSFDGANKVLGQLFKPCGRGGVGIVLGPLLGEGAGHTLIGVDFDSCLNADDGSLADWAVAVLSALGPVYVEISPSGTGVKAFMLARDADMDGIRAALDIPRWWRDWKFKGGVGARKGHAEGIEFVLGHRYFTVVEAGNTPLGCIGVREAAGVMAVLTRVFGDGRGGRARGAGGDVEVTDDMIRDIGAWLPDGLEALTEAEHGVIARLPGVRALWDGAYVLGDDKSASAIAFNLGGLLRRGLIDAEVGVRLMLKHPAVWDWYQSKGEWEGRRQVARAWHRHDLKPVARALVDMTVPRAMGAGGVAGGAGSGAVGADVSMTDTGSDGADSDGADSGVVTELRYDAATIRRLVEAAEAGDVARLLVSLMENAALDALEQEELCSYVAKKAKLAKSAIKQQIKDVKRAARVADADPVAGDWQLQIQCNRDGDAFGNLANAMLFMRWAPELREMVGFDQMLHRIWLHKRVPESKLGAGGALQDADVSEIQEWLQRHGLTLIGRDVVQQAASVVARENAFHPVRNYLNGLVWDGKQRLDTWLKTYLGATTQSAEYLKIIGRCFILSMLYRVLHPGCQCDYMIVLEGAQGDQKTAACNVLAGEWFSNSMPELHGHDDVRVSMHLRGKWLIEIGELSAFKKSDMDKLKNFLTRRVENYTPKYGQNEVGEGRQCVMIGTTNEKEYLRDATGGRRFWPVDIGFIDIPKLTADRDQLLAEAMAAYRAGEQYWPSKEVERTFIKGEQDARYETDIWQDTIQAWLKNPAVHLGGVMPAVETCTTKEIASGALKIDIGRQDVVAQRRIAGIMRLLQWSQDRKTRSWAKAEGAHSIVIEST